MKYICKAALEKRCPDMKCPERKPHEKGKYCWYMTCYRNGLMPDSKCIPYTERTP